MVHVGIDLDKGSSQIALLMDDGEIAQQRLANDIIGLTKFFDRLPAGTPIAIEASGTWWWLVDLLEQLGHRPVLSHPKQTKAIAAARLKNDRVDAERLALLLRGDLLPTVWIPPAALRSARTRPASHSTGLGARRDPESLDGDAGASQRQSHVREELVNPARATRVAAAPVE